MKNLLNFFLVILFFLSDTVSARIITDGTTGSNTALSGPNYKITSDLGKITGNNLFHSFSEFNVYTNESATFSGPSNISNIISRVTGSKSSYIDGLLKSEINGADFYFINPNGVMFGKNASVDVTGSFYVSSADYIKLGDNGRFDAKNPSGSNLSVANPEAFGFFGNNVGEISLQGNYISVHLGKEINIFSGNLKLEDAVLDAPSGKVNLISAGSQGEIKKDNADNEWKPIGFSQMGDIFISRTGTRTDFQTKYNIYDVDVTSYSRSSLPGGSINLYGKNIGLENVTLTSLTPESVIASEKAGNINVSADNLAFFNGAKILTTTYSDSDLGDININLNGKLTFSGETSDGFSSVINSITYYNGNAGNINVNTGNISIIDGGQIGSFSYGDGASGNININNKGSIELSGQSSRGNKSGIYSNIFFTGNGGNVIVNTRDLNLVNSRIQSSSGEDSFGDSGNVVINADNIYLTEGAQISTSAFGTGNAGDMKISVASNLVASGISKDGYKSGIYASTQSEGSGGRLDITAGSLEILKGAYISAITLGTGSAGDIYIDADKGMLISGGGKIVANTFASGKGGSININSSNIKIDQGSIEASGYEDSVGNAGDIKIVADNIELTDGGNISGIAKGTGNAGSINICANKINLQNEAEISVSTKSSGNAGNLDIIAGDINIDSSSLLVSAKEGSTGNAGSMNINAENILLKNAAYISGSTLGEGKGGDIDINVKNNFSILEKDKEGYLTGIYVDAHSKGDAGTLKISASNLYMKEGSIQANSYRQATGNAGDIIINAGNIYMSDSATITGSTKSEGNAGNILINAGNIYMNNDSGILGNTAGTGDGGDIDINASGKISVEGMSDSSKYCGIYVESYDKGKGGILTINASDIELFDGSEISSNAWGDGNAGGIKADVKNSVLIYLKDKNALTPGFYSNTYGKGDSGTLSIKTSKLDMSDGIITASTGKDATGNAGNVIIEAKDILLDEGAVITAKTKGAGNAGNLDIFASKIDMDAAYIEVDSELGSTGKGGTINIESNNITLNNAAYISATTSGDGSAGDINIKVKDTLSLLKNNTEGNKSGIYVNTYAKGNAGTLKLSASNIKITQGTIQVSSDLDSTGNAGDIKIFADNISITEGGVISANTKSVGNAGSMLINAGNIMLSNGSRILNNTISLGNAGDIEINVTGKISIDGEAGKLINSGIYVETNDMGRGGKLTITSSNIELFNGAHISSTTYGDGHAGDVRINVKNNFTVSGKDSEGYSAGVYSNSFSKGDGGLLWITAGNLSMLNGLIQASAAEKSTGNAGKILITANNINLFGGAEVSASTWGPGSAGDIIINTNDRLYVSGENEEGFNSGIHASANSAGNGGLIDITAQNIDLEYGGVISSSTRDSGSAGDININADSFAISGKGKDGYSSGLFATSNKTGDSGSINIKSDKLKLTDLGVISVYSAGKGRAGNIDLDISDELRVEKSGLISAEAKFSSGGDILIKSDKIMLKDYGDISSTVFGGEGGGGDVNIYTDSIVVLNGCSITARADQGKGGNILVNSLVFLRDGELKDVLNASSNVIGNDGTVRINAPELDISGSIAVLPAFYLDITSLLNDPCGMRANKEVSSLVVRDCNRLNFIPIDL